MKGINKVIIVGTLIDDPEVRESKDGLAIANFSLATNDQWKDKTTGESKESTEYHKCVAFGRIVDAFIAPYVTKGAKVYLEGTLQTSSHDKTFPDCQMAHKVYSTQVVVRDLQQIVSGIPKEKPPYTDGPDFKNDDLSGINDDLPF